VLSSQNVGWHTLAHAGLATNVGCYVASPEISPVLGPKTDAIHISSSMNESQDSSSLVVASLSNSSYPPVAIAQPDVGFKPTKTTSTAAYAAVLERTSKFPSRK